MISISFKRDNEGNIVGFETKGHAGFAAFGKDIICAAVSILTVNAVNSVEQFTDDDFFVDQNEKKGIIHFEFRGVPSDSGLLLLKSYELGIKDIVETYDNKFIKIIEWEV